MNGKLLYLLVSGIILGSNLFLKTLSFSLSGTGLATTTLYVDPQTSIAGVDETFSIDVSVAEVTDLYGWEFKLYYLNGVLNATEVTEGPFLKAGGPTYFTGGPSETGGIWNDYNATHGRIYVWCTLLGEIPGVNGSGVLTTITFHVTNSGQSSLALSKTFLINSNVFKIPHETIDGYFSTTVHDIAIMNVTPSATEVCAGQIVKITVVVKNEGTTTENFNVTAYYNSDAIGTQTINDLAAGVNKTLTFNWDTTGVTPGDYTIKAEASMVPGETDTADNTYVDGTVKVIKPPVASFIYSPPSPRVGEIVTFDASASTPNGGNIINYKWDFGDGNVTSVSNPIITHAYPSEGTYNVTLTIADSEGLTDSTWQLVGVGVLLLHDVAITNVTPSKIVVGQGYSMGIYVTVENQGDYTETFNVTAYANVAAIQTQSVTLASGNSTIITYIWNTTGFAKGNYTISAYADPVPGETDTADNNRTDGWVIVAMVGDMTGSRGWPDGKVDIRDITVVAMAFGAEPGDPNWTDNGDLDNNNIIDIRDITTVAMEFGKSDP